MPVTPAEVCHRRRFDLSYVEARQCRHPHHEMSRQHLNHYVAEFTGRHKQRPQDSIDQTRSARNGMDGKG